MLVRPQAAIGRQRGALAVAVAIAPDFGQRAGLADKRVVLRNCAVLGHAHHLAVVVVQGLCIVALAVAIAQAQEQAAVFGLSNAAAKVGAAFDLGALAEQHFHLFQLAFVGGNARRRQGGAVGIFVRTRFAVAKVDAAVGGEGHQHPAAGAGQADIEQPRILGDGIAPGRLTGRFPCGILLVDLPLQHAAAIVVVHDAVTAGVGTVGAQPGERQVDQRILGHGHDQDGAAEAFVHRAQRNPGETADERRHSEGQAKHHAPQPAASQVAALQQPGHEGRAVLDIDKVAALLAVSHVRPV